MLLPLRHRHRPLHPSAAPLPPARRGAPPGRRTRGSRDRDARWRHLPRSPAHNRQRRHDHPGCAGAAVQVIRRPPACTRGRGRQRTCTNRHTVVAVLVRGRGEGGGGGWAFIAFTSVALPARASRMKTPPCGPHPSPAAEAGEMPVGYLCSCRSRLVPGRVMPWSDASDRYEYSDSSLSMVRSTLFLVMHITFAIVALVSLY